MQGEIYSASRPCPATASVERARSWLFEGSKRFFDLVVSLLVILVCLPLFLLIAAAIKLESRGGVLFCQERVGRDGGLFRALKFRSMCDGAERQREKPHSRPGESGPVFKLKDDPRVTRVGALLRRSSLDELPQFFNVLVGQMSLVGPRPLPERDVTNWSRLPEGVSREAVEGWLALRHTVRPGITGLWQVSGRSLLPLQEWIRYDVQYVRERSCLLDAKILALTPFVVLTGRGAV